MGIFDRKGKAEEETELERPAYTRRRRPRASQPTESKKKVFPQKPKPWGKAERYLVAILLGGSAITALILAVTARSGKLPGLPRFSSPDTSFSDTIIVENKDYVRTPAPSVKNAQEETINSWIELTQNLSGIYGFTIVRLGDSSTYGIHHREQYTAASLMKLPVLAALYQESERGFLDLDAEYVLSESDKVGGSGSIQYKAAGTRYTYRKLAEAMGKQSDNSAMNAVVKKLGVTRVKQAIEDFGMHESDYDENLTTPEDVANFFKKLWQAKLITPASRDEILNYLTETIYEDYLAAGIPDDITVSHKYGREVHVINDAGIVFTKKPFIVVMMSKGVVEREAEEVFVTLARTLYDGEKKASGM